jgi:hypothetical protein
MPPKPIKSPREIIYYQYAKIISESSGFGKTNYGMIMTKWKQLVNGEIQWSSSVREWLKERAKPANLAEFRKMILEIEKNILQITNRQICRDIKKQYSEKIDTFAIQEKI